jgi:hypothetical protein
MPLVARSKAIMFRIYVYSYPKALDSSGACLVIKAIDGAAVQDEWLHRKAGIQPVLKHACSSSSMKPCDGM